MARILGEQPLPWEKGADSARPLLRRLGMFRGAVLGLLERDPSLRLSVPDFISRCRSVLERTLGDDGPTAHPPLQPSASIGTTHMSHDISEVSQP